MLQKIKKYLLISIAIYGFLGGILFATIKYYSKFTPNLEQLETVKPPMITKIFDADGNVIKEYYIQKRIIVPLDSMSQYLIKGLIAVEDKNFYNHWGVDVVHGILRAIIYRAIFHKTHGGSSITQQLARNLFLNQEMTISRKIKEAITAVKIEKTYTKEEILHFYLNQVNLGTAYGVEAASRKYFGKHASQLEPDEAAILIGMLKAPNYYRPDLYPERCRKRRNTVLKLMYEEGVITKDQYTEALNKPIKIIKPKEKASDIAPYFVEEVRLYVQKKYGFNAIYTKGLKIYTTLHSDEQKIAEESFQKKLRVYQYLLNRDYYYKYLRWRWKKLAPDSLKNLPQDSIIKYLEKLPKFWYDKIKIDPQDTLVAVQGAVFAIDNKTGEVRILIGGRNFEESEFNRVYAYRQPGSAFKPFIALAAVKKKYTPASILLDQPIVILNQNKKKNTNKKDDENEDWRPKNYHGSFHGPVLFCDAVSQSMNLAFINLLNNISPDFVVNTLKIFNFPTKFEAVPALTLGVYEMRLYDLVKGYSVFANNGLMVQPYMIRKIEDNEGNILEQHYYETKKIIEPDINYIMVDLLKNVISRGTGFGAVAAGFDHPAGGKTGTTNESTDTWFLGFTKHITAGVWIGTDIKRTLGRTRTGANTALPIWTDYMIYSHKNLPKENFPVPDNIVFKDICSKSGKLARSTCPKIYYQEAFIKGTEPKDSCDVHLLQNKSKANPTDNIWGIEKSQEHKGLTF